jgi:hypothetical protein
MYIIKKKMTIEKKIKELNEHIKIVEKDLKEIEDWDSDAREWCEKYLFKLQKKRDKLLKSEEL